MQVYIYLKYPAEVLPNKKSLFFYWIFLQKDVAGILLIPP